MASDNHLTLLHLLVELAEFVSGQNLKLQPQPASLHKDLSKWDSHLSMWIWSKIRYLNWITDCINTPKLTKICGLLVNFGTYGCGQRSQGHVPIPGTKPRGSAVCLAETTHICSVSPVEWRKPDDFHSSAMISTPMHPWDIMTKSLRLKWHHLSGKHSGP